MFISPLIQLIDKTVSKFGFLAFTRSHLQHSRFYYLHSKPSRLFSDKRQHPINVIWRNSSYLLFINRFNSRSYLFVVLRKPCFGTPVWTFLRKAKNHFLKSSVKENSSFQKVHSEPWIAPAVITLKTGIHKSQPNPRENFKPYFGNHLHSNLGNAFSKEAWSKSANVHSGDI